MSEQLDLDLSSPEDQEKTSTRPDPHLPTPHTLADEVNEGTDGRPAKFASSIREMAQMMGSQGELDTGDLAELRRISSRNPYTRTLWYLLFDLGEHEPWGGMDRNLYERRMATLAMSMATCAGYHDERIPLGKALATAGWSDLRFVRLMEARGETLEDHIRRMSQFLASKAQSANWVDVGWLLLSQDWETAEKARLRISRSYYGTLHANRLEQES